MVIKLRNLVLREYEQMLIVDSLLFFFFVVVVLASSGGYQANQNGMEEKERMYVLSL